MRKNTTESELWIKAKDFVNELTSHNVIEKSLTQKNQIAKERVENYTAIQNGLLQRGINLKPKV